MVAGHASIALPRPAVQSSVSCKGLRFASNKMSRGPASSLSLHSRRSMTVRAGPSEAEQPGKTSSAAVQIPPPRTRSGAPSDDSSLQTVFVEDANVSVEGVAKVDHGVPSSDSPAWGRVAFLAGGDVLVLFAFAAIGRLSHGMSVVDWDALRTADPFIAGWLLGAYLLGGYGPDGQGVNGFGSAVLAAVKSWAVGIPLALVIRGVTSGHVPPQPFIIVSMASTLILLVGWRATATVVFPNEKSAKNKLTGNKKGSVFELFQLLSSLVRRW
ncbi:hypothetical protein GOP47_0027345 [Adiantum capillus-veneris]|nr:hypothetical protein GOP47_0027345 [Adiantum capillus-veneris]